MLQCLESNIDLNEIPLLKNKNPKKELNEFYKIPENERKIIKELNHIDYQLYNLALDKFHKNKINY